MTDLLNPLLSALCILFLSATSVYSQHHFNPFESYQSEEEMPLYDDILGDFERSVTTNNAEAQAYFNQGMRLRYAFASMDAARAFKEARIRDPECAICYWGEAWALGPYLNGGGWLTEEINAAIRRALQLSEQHATPVERALIEAMSRRYEEEELRAEEYAEAMQKVYEAFPGDLDVATLYGEALFLLEPRRGSRDLDDPNVQRIHGVFEKVLDVDLYHPGACHLYVHATEATSRPGKADACAEYLADSVPGVSHMNHMPAHTWSQTGRWGDAVRVSLQSVETDRRALEGDGFAIYPSHNLHMLAIVAAMDGQSAVAIQAGQEYAEMLNSTMYQVLNLIRFGRFDDVLAIDERPSGDTGAGSWDFAHGYASLRQGDLVVARDFLERIRESAAVTESRFRMHSTEDLLEILAGILEGEIFQSEGDPGAAEEAFARAVSIEDDLMWDEPRPLPFAARHWLGAHYLDNGQFEQAERVYREDLVHHPNNGWTLLGLMQAVEAQGKSSSEIRQAFENSWARADVEITSSRF